MKIDTALLSKFERGERKLNKEQALAFVKYYRVNADELLLAWLSDKIAGEVQHEALAKEALKEAEKKIELFKKKRQNGESLNLWQNRLEKLKKQIEFNKDRSRLAGLIEFERTILNEVQNIFDGYKGSLANYSSYESKENGELFTWIL